MSADTKFILNVDLLEIGHLQKVGSPKRPLLRHPHLSRSCSLNQIIAYILVEVFLTWPLRVCEYHSRSFNPVCHKFLDQVGTRISSYWHVNVRDNKKCTEEGLLVLRAKLTVYICFKTKKLPRDIVKIN